jgi:hypothetical protein
VKMPRPLTYKFSFHAGISVPSSKFLARPAGYEPQEVAIGASVKKRICQVNKNAVSADRLDGCERVILRKFFPPPMHGAYNASTSP